MDIERKDVGAVEIKDAEKGEVEAVIATLGVVDRDDDVIVEGAIPTGTKVKMSSYGHDAVWGEIPVGKGRIEIDGNRAVFRGKMFLSTARGREVFGVLKEMGADQEWSFGFRVLGSEVPDDEWRAKGANRILTKLDAFEVSPVLTGAGIGTRTLAVKGKVPEEVPLPDPQADEATRIGAEQTVAEAKAADEAAALKERARHAIAEYERVQRTLKRLGVA